MQSAIAIPLALVILASAGFSRADAPNTTATPPTVPAPTAGSAPVPAPTSATASGPAASGPTTATTPETPAEEPPARVNWPGGHVGYALGGAYFDGEGLRSTLDISLDFLHGLDCRSPDVRVLSCSGVMASASLVTGFSASPTYLTLDAGYGVTSFLGWHLLAGPAVRLGPAAGFGFDLQAIVYLFIFEIGPRLIVIPSGTQQAQVTFLIGVGFN
jgi:hypothetical protein